MLIHRQALWASGCVGVSRLSRTCSYRVQLAWRSGYKCCTRDHALDGLKRKLLCAFSFMNLIQHGLWKPFQDIFVQVLVLVGFIKMSCLECLSASWVEIASTHALDTEPWDGRSQCRSTLDEQMYFFGGTNSSTTASGSQRFATAKHGDVQVCRIKVFPEYQYLDDKT